MSYMALYRKWRPQTFDDVIEQDYIITILKNTITTGRIGHAYLFCGTRGTGKTTMAKIFSRAINCENPLNSNPCNNCETCKGILTGSILDVIEIDAASNNSVDNVREIRDEVIYSPAKAKFKVYIIDEVHMLSTGAFNALLKTLEEPPSHVVFILATTEPHKLPITILSRCQRYDFKRISLKSISDHLKTISSSGNIKLDDSASMLIAKLADGALRDGISILDQCMSLNKDQITRDDVISIVGIVDSVFLSNMVDCIHQNNIINILNSIDDLTAYGKDLSKFISDLINYFRNVLVCKISNSTDSFLELPDELLEKIKTQVNFWSVDELSLIIKNLSMLENSLKWSIHPKTLIEVELIKLCDKNYFNSQLNIEEKILVLESKLNNLKEISLKSVSENSNSSDNDKTSKKPIETSSFKKISENQKIKVDPKNFIQVWPEIVENIKSHKKMMLYQELKNANAILKGNDIVEVIVYDAKPINIELLNKQIYIDIVESELSKYYNKEITLKYSFKSNVSDTKDDDFLKKINSMEQDSSLNFKLLDND